MLPLGVGLLANMIRLYWNKRDPPDNPTAGFGPITGQLVSTGKAGKPEGALAQTDGDPNEECRGNPGGRGVLQALRDRSWDVTYKLGNCTGFISYQRRME